MTGFIVSVFPFRNRVSSKEAFEGLELGDGKPSRPVLRGPGGRKAAWLLGINSNGDTQLLVCPGLVKEGEQLGIDLVFQGRADAVRPAGNDLELGAFHKLGRR